MGEYAHYTKITGSNRVTGIWIHGHRGIPRNEETDKLERKGLVESLLTRLL
jgi:ribonuclease HI